jgi:hypothetical protein
MRPRINPWWFLAKLVVLLVVTYLLWAPLAPYYAKFLLRASQVGVWLTEFSFDPTFSHQTQLLMTPRHPTGIFYFHQKLFPPRRLDPQGIPAEWVMANLVLLIPLMLATPVVTWRERFTKLGLALLIALGLQVFDVVVSIKAFYAANFHGLWNPVATKIYQFLDAFVQSWDTQLFPFAIWAGVNFRVLLPERLFAAPPPARASAAAPVLPRAERRRRKRS